MLLFAFDEDEFTSEISAFGIDEVSPTIVLTNSVGHLESVGISIPQVPVRKRSSVYGRVSIMLSTPNSPGIEIPLDFGSLLKNDVQSSNKKMLTDFVPMKVLGQGAFGKVHLVKDKNDGKLYAQKQIRKPQVNIFEKKLDSSPHPPHDIATTVQRIMAERHILSEITHHANIVKLFYALQDHDRFYLLLEYIPGGELFHHLSSNNSLGNVFLEEHVAFYAAQMALGIRHLHLLGIVYRDLKPENCLLNSTGHLVLTDFGLSKNIGNNSDSDCRLIIGTPEYMAPEILKGDTYAYPVDWWLLGCVIYDMMTGKPPFTGNTHNVILEKIIKLKAQYPYYLSLDAKDLLGKLLQKSPGKRMAVDEKWTAFKGHRFFRKIDWVSVENQLVTPPVIPVITDPELAENFSEEFTDMKMSDYNLGSSQTLSSEIEFKGFSYTASHSFIDGYAH